MARFAPHDSGMRLIDDRTGLERLTRDECIDLLGRFEIGRLAVVSHGRPLIFPVNYAMDGECIVFRTAIGTKFDAAVREMAVAFEIDEFDVATQCGWSVIVAGHVDEASGGAQLARLRDLSLQPWAEGDKDHWLVVHPTSISGRRVSHG